MAFGGIKEYHLVHLNFDKNTYSIYTYQKDRRLTANQAWEMIRHSEPEKTGPISNHDTIFKYYDILKEFGYIEKYCDRYMTFRCS